MSGEVTSSSPGTVPPNGGAAVARELLVRRSRPRVARFLRWAAAIPLFILFLIGVATPIMPQIPFLVAALLLVAPDFRPARRLVVRLERKFPSVRRRIPKRWRRTKHGP